MSRKALDELKQQIPLLEYLKAHDWRSARQLSRGRWMGLCPLHDEHQPSFLVDPSKNLFYCYGCGRGGDVSPPLMEKACEISPVCSSLGTVSRRDHVAPPSRVMKIGAVLLDAPGLTVNAVPAIRLELVGSDHRQ